MSVREEYLAAEVYVDWLSITKPKLPVQENSLSILDNLQLHKK